MLSNLLFVIRIINMIPMTSSYFIDCSLNKLHRIINIFFFYFSPQPGSAYMPINVDNSPRSLRGGIPQGGNPPPIQVNAPPPGLGRSGSPANGPTAPATAASLIRAPYSNYAVASAVPPTNHKGPSQGAPTDHVRYYQGVAAAAANNLNPAVASIGQNYSTTRVDPSATVFVRNAVRIAAF